MTDISPAERYRVAQSRTKNPLLSKFRNIQPFDLDPFQISACESVEAGRGVLVAAPTGAGKTIVAEFAIHLAMAQPDVKVFYTTPMKALSNQKFSELVETYGAERVGLLTGDTSINPRAQVVIMTTEVLRNMLYAGSELLENLSYVVMDEVHYLADRFRGAVWEEVIIHLPSTVQVISLSATVSNAEEFGDWLHTVRGHTDVIVSEERPVPLHQHMIFSHKFLPLFAAKGELATVNPEVMQTAQMLGRGGSHRPKSRGAPRYQRYEDQRHKVYRSDVVEQLGDEDLLPAIFFIFSRKGCDQAVSQVLRRGVTLTEEYERDQILDLVEERCDRLDDDDRNVLGYHEWLDGILRGVAAHHAGMLPMFKEVVEELFRRKLLKVVFATETLALGINMPARTVVLEKLDKFNGEARVPITAGEYTQLTGRAGRRGIDSEGHSVVIWQPGINPEAVAALASRRSYPLKSSFSPTYNMAVNLIAQFGVVRTRSILESSFAQFQADRHVVELARSVRKNEEALEGYAEAFRCHLGDFAEYAALRRELSDKEREGGHRSSRRRDKEGDLNELELLRKVLRTHACHSCPDREAHARWATRWWKLERETERTRRQIRKRTGAISIVFERVMGVLTDAGYLQGSGEDVELTIHGTTLRRIYGERDLLVAESLRRQLWNDLDAPSLAAMVAAIVYEPRRDDAPLHPRDMPGGAFPDALRATIRAHQKLREIEADHQVAGTSDLAAHLSLAVYRWASGRRLESVLDGHDVQAGDFVRWCKQIIDVLDQIITVGVGPIHEAALDARARVFRGVVAMSSVA
ncbi:MAG: DEAD/DEAH box helicase [Pontimonas sp.]